MSLFSDWNDLLLCEYFAPASAGEETWIQTTRQELDSFGLHLGGADGLIKAVRSGPAWLLVPAANCADAAQTLVYQRRATIRPRGYIDPGTASGSYFGAKAPSYLPVLALWVLASSEIEDGFYAQVGRLLGQPFHSTPQLTSAMSQAWEDLEQWSLHETAGKFGRFKLRVLGDHRFVGIPRSQCLVSRRDVRGVKQLFAGCDLRPGQALTPDRFSRFVDLGLHANNLSCSLKYALTQEMYRDPLKHVLDKILDSWDGRRPESSNGSQPTRGNVTTASEEVEPTTLALIPSPDDEGWLLQWRFRASGEGNACSMIIGGTRIPARLEPWGACFVTLSEAALQEACTTLLVRSETNDVPHEVEFDDKDTPELGGGVRISRVERRGLRILAWDSPDPRFGEVLIERELPIIGPLYIVCCPSGRVTLERYLANEGIERESMIPRGLPDGWTLTSILHAERLTADQRREFSRDSEAQADAARLRFVGGRPILRGGSRFYAPYDLPLVEVEGPSGVVLSALGIRFEELILQDLDPGARAKSRIRRFKIRSWDSDRLVFEIKILDDGRNLASAKLRIAASDGIGAGSVRAFAIDSLGRSRLDGIGLRGIRLDDSQPPIGLALDICPMPVQDDSFIDRGSAQPFETVCGKFLDSLAQLGSIGYGQARDQLSRLGVEAGINVQPALLLFDLRSRAHLEIQTDTKGHLVRIHSVAPSLYSLPATYDGFPLFGISGSLRVQHWINLLRHSSCIALVEEGSAGRLPAIRLAIIDEDEACAVARTSDFLFDKLPCDTLGQWASSLDQARAELSSWGWSSFSAELHQLQRLRRNSAQFVAVSSGGMSVDTSTRCQLFRFDDPSAPGLQVYVLGSLNANESTGYSFVHDSRWGVWLAEAAFARMMRESLSRDDVYPWPIHYDSERRQLWLPARIKPPIVIERMLTLCAGSGPNEVSVVGSSDGFRVNLAEARSGSDIGGASLVYEAFAPGTWLCYEWVPPDVARRSAALLGGEARAFIRPVARQE